MHEVYRPPVLVGKVAVFVVGGALAASMLGSAVRTMVVPRGLPSMTGRLVFEVVRGALRIVIGPSASYERRDRIMALHAPISLLSLPVVWLSLVLVGYAAMYWALGAAGWRDAYALAGSSLFTLGFRSPGDLPTMTLAFTQAGVGIGLLALLITYLPSLYSTFNRRELAVALLEVRAGRPPTGPDMLIRYHRIGWQGGLTKVWEDWEAWFADVAETHTSLPALVFFRSPHPGNSWVTAAGAILDAASLRASVVQGPHDAEAELCVRAGYVALRQVAHFFGIPYDPDPAPTDPISVERIEFDEVCQRMARAGVPLVPNLDRGWRDFAGWRVNYDMVLVELAALTQAPYAPWSSDRGIVFRRPRLRATVPIFGRRRRG